MESTQAQFWGPVTAALASVSWALGVVAYSTLSEKYPPYIVNFTRILVGLPCFVLILLFQFGPLEATHLALNLESQRYLWLLLGVLCSYAFGDVLFFESARRIGGTSALALASVYPLWAAVSGWFLKGEGFHFVQGAAVLFVVGGTICVILASRQKKVDHGTKTISSRTKWVGVGLGFAASVSWAINTFAISKGGENLPIVLVNVVRLAMGFMLAPLFGVLREGPKSFKLMSWKDLKPFSLFFFAESFFGPLFYMYGITRSPLAVGAVLSSLAPVLTVPVAVLLRTEKFSWSKFFGVVLVVLGIWGLILEK